MNFPKNQKLSKFVENWWSTNFLKLETWVKKRGNYYFPTENPDFLKSWTLKKIGVFSTLVSGKRSRGSPPSNSKLIFKKSQHALANRFSKTVEMALDLAIECTGNTLFEPKIARQLRERCRNSRLDLIYSFFFKKK